MRQNSKARAPGLAKGIDIGKELTRALLVLALVFLSFGHKPIEARIDLAAMASATGVTAAIFCGEVPDDSDHAPCHACRGADAVLPPPPCAVLPAFGAVDLVAYGAEPAAIAVALPPIAASPRAPPVA